jgi:hypothetical protein
MLRQPAASSGCCGRDRRARLSDGGGPAASAALDPRRDGALGRSWHRLVSTVSSCWPRSCCARAQSPPPTGRRRRLLTALGAKMAWAGARHGRQPRGLAPALLMRSTRSRPAPGSARSNGACAGRFHGGGRDARPTQCWRYAGSRAWRWPDALVIVILGQCLFRWERPRPGQRSAGGLAQARAAGPDPAPGPAETARCRASRATGPPSAAPRWPGSDASWPGMPRSRW